jgi:hypothetical protein
MRSRASFRITVVLALTLGLLAAAEPAFALSAAPDPTWGTNGKTYALAKWGNTIFVAGQFTKAVGPSGQHVGAKAIAAFDMTTGAYIPTFTASVTNTLTTAKAIVQALAVSTDGSTLYIGGKFDTVDGQPRQNFAAVDTATGTQLSATVTAQPNQTVQAIVAGPSLVYFGGNFTKVDGVSRQFLAAISATTGALSTTWVPTAAGGTDPCPSQFPTGTNCGTTGTTGGSGNVHSLALSPDGTGLFVGGNFYYINGIPRNSVGEVSATTGATMSWHVPWYTMPDESAGQKYTGPNVVWAILPKGTQVFVGYGRTPNGFEAYTLSNTRVWTSGSPNDKDCTAASPCATQQWSKGTPGNAESFALSPDGTRLFVGGHFGMGVLDYQPCGSSLWAHGLISVNPATGAYYCDWLPQMLPFGGTNAPGSHINPPNYVGGWAMQITSSALFVAGYFTSISGVTQSGLARFTLSGTPPPPPPVPVITSFSPSSGPQGSSVVITGTGFTGASSVSFGSVPATSFTVDGDTQITAVVPGGFTHSPIKVTTPGGTAKSATNFSLIPPSIGSFSPTSGPEGTQVVITGLGFTGATSVGFGGVSASLFNVDSDTQITATVPVGAITGPITVVTLSSGTLTSSTAFTVTLPPPPAPTITSFSPSSGPVGTEVVITGTGFTGATAVSFGSVAATSFTVDSDTQIRAIVPSGFAHSPIKVTTAGGTAKSATNFVVT